MGPTKQASSRTRMLAWLGGVGAAVAWVVHLGAAYWYTEGTCSNATAIASVEPVVIGLTAALAVVALAAALAAHSVWRGVRAGRLSDPRRRLEFMALAGMISSIVFGFAIVLQGVQVLAVDPCVAG